MVLESLGGAWQSDCYGIVGFRITVEVLCVEGKVLKYFILEKVLGLRSCPLEWWWGFLQG